MASQRLLDDIGWMILEALAEDARMNWRELGRRVGLTAPAVADRVRRLEQAGVIKGYRLDVDYGKLGRPLQAIVRLRPAPGDEACDLILETLQDRPEVLECHRATGADCYYVKVAVASMTELEEMLDSLIPYSQTTTSMILSTPVERATITAPEQDKAAVA